MTVTIYRLCVDGDMENGQFKGNAISEQKNQLYIYKTTSYKMRIFRPMGTNIT